MPYFWFLIAKKDKQFNGCVYDSYEKEIQV